MSLTEVRLRDIGVIADATLPLAEGLNVLTGETGAGKTMLLTGVSLLLGARADSALVRAGRATAHADGAVRLPADHPARLRVLEAGGDVDDEVLLARTVTAEGRSRAYAGGRAVPSATLAEIGRLLVAVHGQADQWRLKSPAAHRDLVDAYGGTTLAEALAAHRRRHHELAQLDAELTRLREIAGDRARDAEHLREDLERIARVDPRPGEDTALAAEADRLGHVEAIRAALLGCHAALAGYDSGLGGYGAGLDGFDGFSGFDGPGGADGPSDTGAGQLLAAARAALQPALTHDEGLRDADARLGELAYLVADLAGDVASQLAGLDADPVRLAWVEQRRAEIGALVRRYGADVDDVLAWADRGAQRLLEMDTAADRIEELTARRADAVRALTEAAQGLTACRRRAGKRFAAAVGAELAHLAMGGATIDVQVEAAGKGSEGSGPDGADRIDIRLKDSGAEPRSITRAASGGELSRLMLAIELVAARQRRGEHVDDTVTMIFDEVDAGVGGAAALDVGARLAALARTTQVVVVTHLAQVAAFADRHLVVRKDSDGTVTTSTVCQVTGTERLAELSRMMSGDPASGAGLAHAQDLLDQARARAREAHG